ncbi:hypothetical protein IDSA_02345 [Pseudidiomarina salinarum]|uniref:Diguanylate cyclase n=1 Tax=Pseudidiomarina salinarum TaxID=435908 RepID=A0A094J0F1_9GAMM|nr:EAL domain-containing protein [Pseudidiomarina salinarum]KFZ31564.1 hypothetical protein IDSA_02345 [Pseudidiomarina salinarum]RUO70669.1 GGDEF domain-containing protein [Pseudidiomarina salinarum]
MVKSFRSRLLLMFASLAGGVLLISLIAVWLATSNQSERTIERELEVSERVLGELLAARSAQLLQAAEVLTNDFGFREAVASGDEQTIISALINHGERIGTDLMVLQSPAGEQIAATHELLLLPPQSELIAMDQSAGLVLVDDVIYQLVTVPVNAPNLIAWATLGFAVDNELAVLMQQLTNANISFIDLQHAQVFASSLPAAQQAAIRALPGTLNALTNWLAEQDMAAHLVNLQESNLAFSTDDDLYILLTTDRAAAAAEFLQLRRQYIGIGVGTLLVALLLAGITARRINQPLARLSEAAETLRSGDYSEPVELNRSDEFGQLGKAFDSMRQAIGEREQHIVYQVEHDLLTGLPNRTSFQRRLNQSLQNGSSGVLGVLNLIRFREINDRLGQRIGDQILQLVGKRLENNIADGWWLGRLAGDEFVLLGDSKDLQDFEQLLARLKPLLEQRWILGASHYLLDFRIGYLEYPDHGEDVDTLVRRAQICSTLAKQKKQFARAYDVGMDESYMRRLQILKALPEAVSQNKLQLHFQPKLDCQQGNVIGAEALVRWRHDELGVVRPDEFIPLAEQTGEINRITRWVCAAALDQLQLWHEQGHGLMMAINLSALDLQWDELGDYLTTLLRERGLPPDKVTLEVTESAVMADPEQAIERLGQLRAAGMRISIDDYGTGYSSLAQLKRLPVDELKLDRSFITELSDNMADQTIVRSTLALAQEMKLATVAEGVEDDAAWQVLRSLGCQTMQGFYFSRPLAATEFDKWLQSYKAPQ